MRPHKRLVPASLFEGAEAPGQLGGSDNLEDDIALCPRQTINSTFLRLLPREGRILEAGAGRGRWVFHLRRQGFDVQGIELASSEVEFARKHDPSVPMTTGNVLRLPYEKGFFGAVISLGVLEHFEEGPAAALKEIQRVLVPSGLLFVTVPIRNLFRLLFADRLKDIQTLVRRLGGEHLVFEEYRYTLEQFTRLLTAAGFSILERTPDDFHPPRNMGLYTDSRLFRARGKRWELNQAGSLLRTVCDSFSPWLTCSGALWVCRSHGER